MNRFIFLSLTLFCSNLFAQTDTLSKKLEEVVISANKFDQLKKDVPYLIQKIKRSDIEFQNNRNTASLLEQNGKAFVQYSQAGGGSPVLRGFEASRILLVVDGIRVNNAIFRAGHLQNILRFSPNTIDNIEVLYGSGSTIYGSDALGGVIHLQTIKPILNHKSLDVSLGGATATSEKNIGINFNVGHRKFSSLTSLNFSEFGDIVMGKRFKDGYENFGLRNFSQALLENKDIASKNENPYRQSPSGYSQFNIMQKFLFAGQKINHGLNFIFSSSSNVPRYDRLSEMQASGISPTFAQWYYGPEKHALFAYNADLKISTKAFTKARLSVSYQDLNESRISRRWNNKNRNNQLEDVDGLNVNFDFRKIFTKSSLQYGLETVTNWVSSRAFSENIDTKVQTAIASRYPNGGSKTINGSFYGNYAVNIKSWMDFNAGLRFNANTLQANFKDKTFFPFPFSEIVQSNSALSYNLSFNLKPSERQRFTFLHSTAYRTPNVDDLAKVFESTTGRLMVPNPNLKPERVNNFEINSNVIFGDLSLELSFHSSQFIDIIATDKFTLDGNATVNYLGVRSEVFASQNLGKATIKGFFGGLVYKLGKYLSLNSSITYTDGKYKDGKYLDHIPPVFGKSAVHFLKTNLRAELYTVYNGQKTIEKYAINGEDNPQYATKDGSLAWASINAKASYVFFKKLSLNAGVENILDSNIRNFASGISSPGRNFIISLRFKS